jgi:hypothetical protein
MTERLLTTAEAAAWLSDRGVSRTLKTLEALRVRGGKMAPPFRRVGRSVRYAEGDLTEWLQEVTSAPIRSTSQVQDFA